MLRLLFVIFVAAPALKLDLESWDHAKRDDGVCFNALFGLDFEHHRTLDWIAYHSLMGVNCFTLHLDACRSNLTNPDQHKVYKALKTLPSVKIVETAVGCKGRVRREPIEDFVAQAHVKYHSNIDVDEFLVLDADPQNGTGNYTGMLVPPNLISFLNNVSSDALGVYLHRWFYGTNGYAQPPPTDKPEFFYLRERWGYADRAKPLNKWGKFITNLQNLPAGHHVPNGVHIWERPNFKASGQDERDLRDLFKIARKRNSAMVLPDGQRFCPNFANTGLGECLPEAPQPLFINHYYSGSFQHCIDKVSHGVWSRRSADECNKFHKGTPQYEEFKKQYGMIDDPIMVKYAAATRQKCAELFPNMC